MATDIDVAIIGGGYYGCYAATEIKRHNPDFEVAVFEKERELFQRASSSNQGQFHMGYIYSADPELARECVDNKQRFLDEFGDAVDHNVRSTYGIHRDSEISADDYVAFCEEVGLELREDGIVDGVYGEDIVAAFSTREKTFNSDRLQKLVLNRLIEQGVSIFTGVEVTEVGSDHEGLTVVSGAERFLAHHVINAAFADINELHHRMGITDLPIQYDVFMHSQVRLEDRYRNVGATVIRGPFASVLPTSYRGGGHLVASGAYRRVDSSDTTLPHEDADGLQAREIWEKTHEDTASYLPMLGSAIYTGFTIGTRAAYRSSDAYTSKPMFLRDYGGVPNYHVLLGGKVSCLFDIVQPIREALAA